MSTIFLTPQLSIASPAQSPCGGTVPLEGYARKEENLDDTLVRHPLDEGRDHGNWLQVPQDSGRQQR
jgi:hypothetical protein